MEPPAEPDARGEEGAARDVADWRRRAPREIPSGFRSPRVRRLARELDVDLDELAASGGSGLGGRVTAADVVARAPASIRIPFDRIRARTATALVTSKRVAAHAFTSIACDYANVDAARLPARAAWRAREGFSLTYLPFVARAVVDSLRAFPAVNASVDGTSLLVHPAVHLSIAVDLDHGGLVVPVIRDADALNLAGIARAIVDVAGRARDRRLVPDDLAGGTFTITNPGAHGTYVSVPIINQPQLAILSTDGVRKQVVVDAGDRGEAVLVIRSVGYLGCSFDHRALDGAYVGAFLAHVSEILETRDWSAEIA